MSVTSTFDPVSPFGDYTSYFNNVPSEPEVLQSEPSTTRSDNYFSSVSPTSPFASDDDSTNTCRNMSQVFYCDVEGCELKHSFSTDLNLRLHQESRHPNLFPPNTTYVCPVQGCYHQHWPFVMEENLQEHMRLNHSDVFLDSKGLEDINPLQLSKEYRVGQYLANEYALGMNNDMVAFPARNMVQGENPPFLQTTGRITTSSRGRGGIRKPTSQTRRSSTSSRTAPIPIPGRPAGPARQAEMERPNAMMTPLSNDMRSPGGIVPSYVQGPAPPQGQFSNPPNSGYPSAPIGNTYAQQPNHFIGPAAGITYQQPRQPFQQTPNFQPHMAYGMPTSMPQQQVYGNPAGYQIAHSSNPIVNQQRRRGPSITVRPPTFYETTTPNPYATGNIFARTTLPQSSMLNPHNSPAQNSSSQQSYNMQGSSRGQQQQAQNTGMQNTFNGADAWMADPMFPEDTQSMSDWEHVSFQEPSSGSIAFSSPGSEMPAYRRTSNGSMNQVGSMDQYVNPGLSTPNMGQTSSSSAASPYTFAEAPMPIPGLPTSQPADLGMNDFDENNKYVEEDLENLMSGPFMGLDNRR
jgi:hypothetical protein